MLVYVSWFANKGNIKCVVKSLTQLCTDSLFVLMVASCSSVVHWAELGQVGNPQTTVSVSISVQREEGCPYLYFCSSYVLRQGIMAFLFQALILFTCSFLSNESKTQCTVV